MRQAFIELKNLDVRTENTCDFILRGIQIYFLTNYLVENTENSISETLDFKIEHHLNIFLVLHFKLRSAVRAASSFAPFCGPKYYTLNVWSRGKQLVLFSRES